MTLMLSGVLTLERCRNEVIDNPGMYYEMHYRAMNNYYKSTGMNDQAAWLEANKNLFGSGRWIGI